MAFRERFSHISHLPREDPPFPQLPPSLEPHPDPQVEYTHNHYAAAHTILPYHTPYLGLRARLSQIWLNRWTILLALIIVRVLIAVATLGDSLDTGRREALSACAGVESMGSAMVSLPHYMAQGVNEVTAKGIEHTVNGLQDTLLLGMQAIEEIVVFVVHLLISTYVCLLTFAVKSSVGTVIDATKDATEFINDTLKKVSDSIVDDSKKFQDTLNGWAGKLNSVSNLFGSDNKVPELKIGALDQLKDIQIPHEVQDKLELVEKSLPDFKTAQNFIDNKIRTPFDFLRQQVNNSLSVYEFNRGVFPIPQKEKLTFCSDNPAINDFFDHLTELVLKARNIIVGVAAALAVLVIIPMGYREWWRYRTMRQRAYMLASHGQEFDPVDIVHISSRPYSTTFGLKAAARFKSSRRQIFVRWFFAYITTPAALFVLALGIAGLFSALGQYIVLRVVEVETPALAAQVGEFAGIVVQKLEDASMQWAVDANQALNETTKTINEDVLGWVKNGTQTVNDTLNFFVDEMDEGITSAFGGTPLEEPVKQIVNCLIEIKVRGIEKGLTWVHDHAHVTLPLLPNNTFSVGAAKSIGSDADSGADSFLSDTSSKATDKITDVIVKLSNRMKEQIQTEAYISGALVGVWLLLCIVAAVRTGLMLMTPSKGRGEGGDKVFTGENRAGFSPQVPREKNGF
jgi:hypothetical protein